MLLPCPGPRLKNELKKGLNLPFVTKVNPKINPINELDKFHECRRRIELYPVMMNRVEKR
jgi:hypothetical protein